MFRPLRRLRRSTLHKEQARVKKRRNHKEDRFSKLPDEIILQILYLLTIKQAITTSLLSRRWRYLWTFIFTGLAFDSGKLLCDEAFHKKKFIKDEHNYVSKFVNSVNYVLTVNQSIIVNQVKVCFSLDARYSGSVKCWVMFAIMKRVQILELNFTSFRYGSTQLKPCTFPDIGNLMLASDNRLKILRLIGLNVSDQVIHHVLKKSPLLEELCIIYSKTTSYLKIDGNHSLRLKLLVLHGCESLEKLEIYAPNLVSFSYSGPKNESPFRNTPLVSELFISHGYCKSFINEAPKHLSYFSQLINLTLVLPEKVSTKCCYREDFPKLNNLKQLEVRVGVICGYPLCWLTYLIEAAPVLSKFVVKLEFVWTNPVFERNEFWRNEKIGTMKYFHGWLQEIEVVGFIGHATEFLLAVRLLEMSGVLEKFTIDTRHPGSDMYVPDVLSRCFVERKPCDADGKIPKGTKEMANKLRSYVPPGAQLHIILDNAFLP